MARLGLRPKKYLCTAEQHRDYVEEARNAWLPPMP